MSDLFLMKLAARQADWLAARESALAANIANVNTPGYRARDVDAFEKSLGRAGIALAQTNARHIPLGPDAAIGISAREEPEGEANLSGNSVKLEAQLMKIGDVSRAYSMNVNIKRVFHQMLTASSR